ncbi:MAG: hypothetical protein OHK0022_32200 [Roseiflexaceae bacterium]
MTTYLVWLVTGVVVALAMGAAPMRRFSGAAMRVSPMAGAFGGLIGGIIGDGLPGIHGYALTVPSMLGATLGALALCLAMRSRLSDVEP